MKKQLIKAIDETVRLMQESGKPMSDFQTTLRVGNKLNNEGDSSNREAGKKIFKILEEEGYVIFDKEVGGGMPTKKSYQLTTKGMLYKSWKKEQREKPHNLAKTSNRISWLALFISAVAFGFSIYGFYFH